jgi:hypothetical protein
MFGDLYEIALRLKIEKVACTDPQEEKSLNNESERCLWHLNASGYFPPSVEYIPSVGGVQSSRSNRLSEDCE